MNMGEDITVANTPNCAGPGPVMVPDDPWVHRAAGMKCKTCMYFVPKIPTETKRPGYDLGRCRRNAPTTKGFPVVFANDWCGEHRIDENKI